MKPSARASDKGPAFLASEIPPRPPEACRIHVLPVPFEATVSYGAGTSRGPRAILEASRQLEAWDGSGEPCRAGIHTHPPLPCRAAPVTVLARIRDSVSRILDGGHVPFLLGGEHTLTLGAVRALRAAGRPFGVLQFDAHADLRDRYEDNPLSHACVMRRILDEGIPLFQVGVRALSRAEHDFREEHGLPHVDARRLREAGEGILRWPPGFPRDVYVTFDVDVFDAALMPATGTPEPGGLDWHSAVRALEILLAGRRLVGADIVELAPVPGWHAPDYVAARLAYLLMGWAQRKPRKA